MGNMTIIDYYKEELSAIKFDSVRNAVELILSRAPSYYMEVDSASKKSYSKDKDGNIVKLRDHTKEVARYILLFLSHPTIRYQFSDIQRDYMVGASLIHDLVKRGLGPEPSQYNLWEHPILVAKLVEDYTQMNPQVAEHICRIVNIAVAHNGPWNKNQYSDIVLPEITDNMQFYVHLSDWLASRGITWIDTSDESIKEFLYDK